MTLRKMKMKTVGTAQGGGAAALVECPMKSSKCKLIHLGEQNCMGEIFFFLCDFCLRYVVVFPITPNIH